MGAVLAELQGGCVFRQGSNIHIEEVKHEFTIDVMELIFVFTIFKVLFINFLKIFDIVWAFWIYTFVNDEVFSILLPF